MKLYHGTTPTAADAIQRDGLHAPDGTMYPAKWYMLTTNPDQAEQYGNGAVIVFDIPNDQTTHRGGVLWPGTPHNVYGHQALAYAPKGTIPAAYITAVEKI